MKIALDIDGVIADIQPTLKKLHPEWDGTTYHIDGLDLTKIPYFSLPVLDKPDFNFVCYITSRPDWAYLDTIKWLAKNGFPKKPLILSNNKLEAMYEWEVNLLIDDKMETWYEINQTTDKQCFLYSQPWNLGAKTLHRINTLSEMKGIL